eukprot:5422310-Amphidinium_carterae.1
MPFLSASNKLRLEQCLYSGGRLISGCIGGTSNIISMAEADLVPLDVRATERLLGLVERLLRSPAVSPLLDVLLTDVPKIIHWPASKDCPRRLRPALRDSVLDHLRQHDLGLDLPRTSWSACSSVIPVVDCSFVNFFHPIENIKKISLEERQRLTRARLTATHCALDLWTDGSVSTLQTNGGSGVCLCLYGSLIGHCAGPAG